MTKHTAQQHDDADALVTLLRSLYVATDERQVSYIQATVNLVVSDQAAQTIVEKTSAWGFPITQRDV